MIRYHCSFAALMGCLSVMTAASNPALAATETTNLSVTATVADTCSIEATTLNFSAINLGAHTDDVAPAVISVACSASKPLLTVVIGGGANENAGQRRMSDGAGAFVPYQLFANVNRLSPIPIGTGVGIGSFATAQENTVSIYGRVPAGTYKAGTYNDVISVTVNY